MKQTVKLPWPPKGVSPNARHRYWAAKVSANKGYRLACFVALKEQHAKRMEGKDVHAAITFHPPDRRARDIDNMLASIKAGIDAVSGVIGIDDSNWSLSLSRGEPKPKQGEVVIELEAA